jgi:F0F1-type ATP synthase membrane subunit a
VVPLALTVALTALELLVAFLQAYVFAMLTCIISTTPFMRDIERTGGG